MFAFFVVLPVVVVVVHVHGYEICGASLGGGVCPTGNTCCSRRRNRRQRRFRDDGNDNDDDDNKSSHHHHHANGYYYYNTTSAAVAGCIPNDMGSYNGTCCSDGKTGCAVGYKCRTRRRKRRRKRTVGEQDELGEGQEEEEKLLEQICIRNDDASRTNPPDPLVKKMPRYRLCHTDQIRKVYGFPVMMIENEKNVETTTATTTVLQTVSRRKEAETATSYGGQEPQRRNDEEEEVVAGGSSSANYDDRTGYDDDAANATTTTTMMMKLAYYSSHGDITRLEDEDDSKTLTGIDTIIIVIHGSNRNADDYFCTAMIAAESQEQGDRYRSKSRSKTMVIAPRFPTLDDEEIDLIDGGQAVRWKEDGGNGGSWRYGGTAAYPLQSTNISSFAMIDQMIQQLTKYSFWTNNNSNGGNGSNGNGNTSLLPRLVIMGHSAGGQFVQRYSLMTSNWDIHRYRAIVANPSSYAYLTPLRYVNDDGNMAWKIPSKDFIRNCPDYNHWEWGLQQGAVGPYNVSYVQDVIDKLNGNITVLKHRFSTRDVIYMIGGQDRCNVSSSKTSASASTNINDNDSDDASMTTASPTRPWCYSHGLETSCMDIIQGTQRYERHDRYIVSLSLLDYDDNNDNNASIITTKPRARSIVVPNVGHDHSLMFNSPMGIQAIFGD